MEVQVEKIIDRIDDWKNKHISCEPLGGGITNHNYKININGDSLMMRIPGAETDLFIDRNNEFECSIEAGKTGVASQVVHHLKPENILVIRFIQGKTLCTEDIIKDSDLIVRIVKSIKTVHNHACFKSHFGPFKTITTYLNYIHKYNAPLPHDIEWMLDIATIIKKSVRRNQPAPAACHNDLLSENFLDDGKKIWIIDWEYGGQGGAVFRPG